MAVKLHASACSDKGCVRQNNEDSFCLNGHYLERDKMDAGGLFKCIVSPAALFAVCDGMGGEEAGEEASLLSVKTCAEYLKSKKKLTDRDNIVGLLHTGCENVYAQAQQRGNHSGATLAMIAAEPEGVRIANMGDSRIYRLNASGFKQLSYDHTEMQRLLNLGKITPEQIKTHPKRHMINQYWGMPLDRAPFTPYISEMMPYEDKDRYLICSDGLTDMLTDAEIAQILGRPEPVERISEELVRQAKLHGGRDNVTVIVIEVAVGEGKSAGKKKKTDDVQALYGLRTRLRVLLGVVCALDLYLLLEWVDFLFLH